jgi:hypothetical protein
MSEMFFSLNNAGNKTPNVKKCFLVSKYKEGKGGLDSEVGGGLDSEGWSLFSCVTQNIGEGL